MDITINNLRFEYDEKSNCINTYDALTNSVVSYIHVINNEITDKDSFENTCQRWVASSDFNSWY